MRIKPFTLLKVLLLLGFINKQYQRALMLRSLSTRLILAAGNVTTLLVSLRDSEFLIPNGKPRAYLLGRPFPWLPLV